MEQTIKAIMAKIFNVNINELPIEKISPENIEAWDSLKHMNLILSIEEELKVEFSDEELINMMDYESIISVLKNK